MPENNGETQLGRVVNPVLEARNQIRTEIRGATDSLQRAAIGRRLVDLFGSQALAAQEIGYSIRTNRISGAQEEQGNNIAKTMSQVLEASKEGVIQVPVENKALVANIADRIGGQLNGLNAPMLYELIGSLISEPVEIERLNELMRTLSSEYSVPILPALKQVAEGIIDTARQNQLGSTVEDAKRIFGTFTEEQQIKKREKAERGSFAYDWEQYYRSFFREDQDDRTTIEALYDREKFADFIKERRKKVIDDFTSKNNGRDPDFNNKADRDEVDLLTSEDVEREIVLRFSKLYLRLDNESPKEFFENIAQQGFPDNINAVQNRLMRQLDMMREEIGTLASENPEEYKRLFSDEHGEHTFFTRFSDEGMHEKKVTVKKPVVKDGVEVEPAVERIVRYRRIVPTAGSTPIDLRTFLQRVRTMVEHEVGAREYLHNVQALFLQPAGEGGFWGQLGRYAERITSADIDAMMLLPDSEIFIAANRLYTKYLEEEMARVDWTHQANMFSADFFNNQSKIIQEVTKDLQKLYPDELGGAERWRLQRAVSMGIGLSRGIFLNEAEIAAWADPAIEVEPGKISPKLVSYYTNDSAALTVLNPLHHFLRWQSEGVQKGPLIFMPVIGADGSLPHDFMRKGWDHRVLWEQMQKAHRSFLEGKMSFDEQDREAGLKLFIDKMPNFARAGSFFTRAGWRSNNAIEGWLQYGKDGKTIKVIESWKALENIGFEAVVPLVGKMGDFLKSKDAAVERSELFSYLFKTYINADNHLGDISHEAYIASIRGKGESDESVNKKYVYRALAHMLRQRTPTKLIAIERNRQTKDGLRAWEKIRSSLTNPDGKIWDADTMDENMKLLMMVETGIRKDASAQMHEQLKKQRANQTKQDLSTVTVENYVVNDETIKKHLELILTRQYTAEAANKDDTAAIQAKVDQKIKEIQSLNKKIADHLNGNNESELTKIATNLQTNAYPFAIAVDELDSSFLAMRAGGPRVLARALGDTSKLETEVYNQMVSYLGALHPLSVSGKHDYGDLIKTLHHMKEVVESIHGHDRATQLVYDLAALTIGYFKKDSIAANNFTRPLLQIGRKNSLAAEFAGTFRNVWEWEAEDVDNFIVELEKWRILPKDATDLAIKPEDITHEMSAGGKTQMDRKRLLGLFPYRASKPETEHYLNGKSLRKNFGATKVDLVKNYANKYLIPLVAGLGFFYFSRALREEEKK